VDRQQQKVQSVREIQDPHARPPGGFTYVDVFAGSSAFTEQARHFGGKAKVFVEWEKDDHPLLRNMAPDAQIYGDFYAKEWLSFQSDETIDALVAWPMCKHLARCGLLKMQCDEVASQLWDIAELAEHLDVRIVLIENVLLLELADEQHHLFSRMLIEFEARGFVRAAVWRVDDSGLGGYTWRSRPWVILHRAELTAKIAPVFQPAMESAPVGIRDCLMPLGEVEHLKVDIVDLVEPDGWVMGYFRFEWKLPLQPGTLVNVPNEQHDHCVIKHKSELEVLVRSKNNLQPTFRTVDVGVLTPAVTLTKLRSLDSPCVTVRSSPDPPGNAVVWEDRGLQPFARLLHENEIWNVQSRGPGQLDLLVRAGASREQIINKAGKAVTGVMARYMAQAVSSQCLSLRAADHGCISPRAETWRPSVRVVPMHTLSHSAVVAQGGGMLMGDFVHRCRESAAVVARRLVAEQFQSAGFLALAGEELVDGVPQWLFVLAMCEMELPKANNVLHWERLEKLKGSPSWRHVIAANLRLCEFISPSVLKLERQLATGKAEQVLITDGSCRLALSWQQHAKAAGEALVELQCTFAAAAECASTESEAEQL
jgi:site-specific DNA-cytosine methylase